MVSMTLYVSCTYTVDQYSTDWAEVCNFPRGGKDYFNKQSCLVNFIQRKVRCFSL